MDFLINYWWIILAFICVLAFVVVMVQDYVKLPMDEKMKSVREWLKYAVFEAEKQFGTKTGQLKLRYVYGLFIQQFPKIANIITFDRFSTMVDEALVWLDGQLSNNEAVFGLVEKG